MLSQFMRFGIVGVAGLLVDLAVLFLVAPWLNWYGGRVVSFWAAASSTWWLNRRITFRQPTMHNAGAAIWGEYLRYIGSMLGGAALNFGAYILILHFFHGPSAAALGVAVGSCAGMMANFMAAKFLVFKRPAPLKMQPLEQWKAPTGHTLVGVFTDIDDTLTADGTITSDALQALADLKAAGLHVIPITGRPVGWSEPMAASWPVDAIVAENGAVALLPPSSPARADLNEKGLLSPPDERWQLQKLYQQDAGTRSANFARMQAVLQQIEATVPEARRAEDSPGRETDIAIDHSEFTHLPQVAIDHAVALMRSAGMNATVSSIHINGWFGAHNKLEGARWITRALFDRDLDQELNRWVYVGDSTNDQLMFQSFEHSFGVANIRRFEAQLSHLPRYVTPSERGSGFAEVARAILAGRAQT